MAYGLTDAGFVDKPLEVIKAELESDQRAAISPTVNTSSASALGQLNGIFASKLRELWEVALSLYGAFDPDSAAARALDNVSAITGTLRAPAYKSTVVLSVTLNAGVTLPAGSVAAVSTDPTARFVTLEDVTNGGGSPAVLEVDAEAETAGAVRANSGTLTTIATPVAGWTAVTNDEDATLGGDIETDAALRVRREDELRQNGSATVESIRADLLQVEDVLEVVVFENVTMTTDGDGLPPKSIEAVVRGTLENVAEDLLVAEALWLSKPAGIETFGSTTIEVYDTLNVPHDVSFSRPTVVEVWLEVDLVTDPLLFPDDGDQQIQQALVDYGDANYRIGTDVVLSRLYAAIFSIPGVTDITEIRAGLAASPVGTVNLVMDPRELAELDTSRIVINF